MTQKVQIPPDRSQIFPKMEWASLQFYPIPRRTVGEYTDREAIAL